MLFSKSGLIAACFICFAASAALPATTTGNLSVTATVLDTCIVATGTALTFASISPSAVSNETVPGLITVICTATRSGLSVTVGAGADAVSGQRQMNDGTNNLLPYNIFSDAGHAAPVAVGGTIYSGGITAAIPIPISVYGQIPAGSYAAGVYSDTVLVTLNY